MPRPITSAILPIALLVVMEEGLRDAKAVPAYRPRADGAWKPPAGTFTHTAARRRSLKQFGVRAVLRNITVFSPRILASLGAFLTIEAPLSSSISLNCAAQALVAKPLTSDQFGCSLRLLAKHWLWIPPTGHRTGTVVFLNLSLTVDIPEEMAAVGNQPQPQFPTVTRID